MKTLAFGLFLFLSFATYAQEADFTLEDRQRLAKAYKIEADLSAFKTESIIRLVRIETKLEESDERMDYIGNLILILIAGIFSFMGFII
jgi:hypothetical protein